MSRSLLLAEHTSLCPRHSGVQTLGTLWVDSSMGNQSEKARGMYVQTKSFAYLLYLHCSPVPPLPPLASSPGRSPKISPEVSVASYCAARLKQIMRRSLLQAGNPRPLCHYLEDGFSTNPAPAPTHLLILRNLIDWSCRGPLPG